MFNSYIGNGGGEGSSGKTTGTPRILCEALVSIWGKEHIIQWRSSSSQSRTGSGDTEWRRVTGNLQWMDGTQYRLT